MPKSLIVNNKLFNYPRSGDQPGWGGDATEWACEVTRVLSNLLGPNDILETSFNIANNRTETSNVIGLVFNNGSVRSAEVEYSVFRISDDQPQGNTETGIMRLVYDNNAGWCIAIGNVVGNSGVVFELTPAGQIVYTSTDIGSLNYVGVMKFRARALQQ